MDALVFLFLFCFHSSHKVSSSSSINTKHKNTHTKYTKGGIVGWIAGVALGVSDSYDSICPTSSTSVHPEPIMKKETHGSPPTPKKMVTKAIVVHHHEDRPSDRPSEEPDSPRDQRDASLENNSESDPEIQDYNPKHESMKSIRTF
jgi:hypothetical protein